MKDFKVKKLKKVAIVVLVMLVLSSLSIYYLHDYHQHLKLKGLTYHTIYNAIISGNSTFLWDEVYNARGRIKVLNPDSEDVEDESNERGEIKLLSTENGTEESVSNNDDEPIKFNYQRTLNKYIKFLKKKSKGKVEEEEKENPMSLEKGMNQKKPFKMDEQTLTSFLKAIRSPVAPTNFITLQAMEELHTLLWQSIFGGDFNKYNSTSTANIDHELNRYRKALLKQSAFLMESDNDDVKIKRGFWGGIVSNNKNSDDDASINKKVLAALHQSLYPWLYGLKFKTLADIIEKAKGRGIVICTGKKHYPFAISTIDTLRHVLGCQLPIQIFHNGKDELDLWQQEQLKSYKDVEVVDIKEYLDGERLQLNSWAIKPFSILASKFEEVILMDADVTYLRNPEELFDIPGYQETGTLFFRDRTAFPGANFGSIWIHQWMKHPLPETKISRFYNELSAYEMESSTVVIHKSKTLLGLLATCKLNEGKIRDEVVYKKVHGDKETFWIGFDMARQYYHMNETPCAFVGEVEPKDKILCGHLGQKVDGKLYFWNGHLIQDKSKVGQPDIELVDFNGYAEDIEGYWIRRMTCLQMKEGKEITYFSNEERDTFNKIIEREKEKKYLSS